MDRGANVNQPAQTADRMTPLYAALANGHVAFATFLLEKAGADPKLAVKADTGMSSLCLSVQKGLPLSFVKLILCVV